MFSCEKTKEPWYIFYRENNSIFIIMDKSLKLLLVSFYRNLKLELENFLHINFRLSQKVFFVWDFTLRFWNFITQSQDIDREIALIFSKTLKYHTSTLKFSLFLEHIVIRSYHKIFYWCLGFMEPNNIVFWVKNLYKIIMRSFSCKYGLNNII